MANTLVSPSVLAADFANLQREIEMLNDSEADYIHIDIMDGVFVPNISFGFPVAEAIHKHAKKPMDFHLMIKDADSYLDHCIAAGAQIISVHIEACNHLHRTLTAIQSKGVKAGIAINPHTSINTLESILPFADLVLVMSVNPGFGGQSFIDATYGKVAALRKMADRINPKLIIEIDGGVNDQTGKKLVESGADMLVAGSYVFKSDDPLKTISGLKKL
jgi:ribulose-phosphate 3-epimerase